MNATEMKPAAEVDSSTRPPSFSGAFHRTPPGSSLSFNKGIAILILIGLVSRIGFFVEHAGSPSFGVPTLDQTYYDTVARMLLAGADLHALHGFRPLLYPAFLAFWYKIGGAWGVDLALFAQHLLGIATGLLVALLGRRVFKNPFAGLIAGGLYLLAPLPLYFEGELLIEPSYTFLISLGLVLALHAAESEGWKAAGFWTLCGALTVLTSQARANILIFLGAYPLFALWRFCQTRNARSLIPTVALAGALLMAIPWGFVNMKQMDHFHLLPNAGGVAFYCGNKRTADGMVPEQERRISSGERYEDSIEVWAREEYESAMRQQGRQPDADPMAISHYWMSRSLAEIKAAPAQWLHLMAKKCWLTLWNVEIPNNKSFAFVQQEFLSLKLLPIRWVILLLLMPAGIWAAIRSGNRDALFLVCAYAALYSAANVAFFICDRYRYPVWLAMAVFAGGGLVAAWEIVRKRAMPQAAWLAASMALLAALSLHNWFSAQLPSFARDFLFRSLASYQKGHYQAALADINSSIALDPADANALHHRANVLFALNRFDEARCAYLETLKQIPQEAGAWNNLGATLNQMGLTDEALEAFSRATTCQPPSRNAFLAIAFIQIRTGHLEAASKALDSLEKLDPTPDAAVLATRSIIERRNGNPRTADVLAEKARRLDPDTTVWVVKSVASPKDP
ncbi:MAG TPA: tetratricopeptide repeat protein [Verrucomicrobiae bacterium]|nr:tetratricopeptide repeat protein [Verrucomicrobiae bacterium]